MTIPKNIEIVGMTSIISTPSIIVYFVYNFFEQEILFYRFFIQISDNVPVSLPGTIPIEFPEGSIHEISPAVVPIIYSKAGAVMRMFHHFLGEEPFKKILHNFLAAYQYSSANTEQFLDVMSPFIDREVSEAWIRRKGFPLLTVERDCNTLHLRQEPFSSPNKEPAVTNSREDSHWPIPVSYSLFSEKGEREERTVLFDKKEMVVHLPPSASAVYVNSDRSGFYRGRYSDETLASLEALGRAGHLHPRERFGIVDDLFALLLRGEVSIDAYLAHLRKWYPGESSFLPLAAIGRRLKLLYILSGDAPSGKQHKHMIREVAEELLLPALEKTGFSRGKDEPFQKTVLRGELMTALCSFEQEQVLQFLKKEAHKLSRGEAIDPNLEALIMKAGAGEEIPFPFIDNQIRNETDEARKVRLISSLPHFPQFTDLEKLFEYSLKNAATRNWHILFNEIRYIPHLRRRFFDWFIDNLAHVKAIHSLQGAKIMIEAIVWGGLGRKAEVKARITSLLQEKQLPSEETAIMALDYLDIYNRVNNVLEA